MKKVPGLGYFLVVYFVCLLLIMGLIARCAAAAEFLTCDSQEGVVLYQVEINDQEQAPIPAQPGGILLFDLEGKPAGQYKFRARAAGPGEWWSEWSLLFPTVKPGTATGLKVIRK